MASVLLKHDLSGLASLFASNLDAAGPEARRLHASNRVEALRQERMSLESAARRSHEMEQHLRLSRIMSMERRLIELQKQGTSACAPQGLVPTALEHITKASTRVVLQNAKQRFESLMQQEAPRRAGERHANIAQEAALLRSQREELESRSQRMRQEYALELELKGASVYTIGWSAGAGAAAAEE